MLANPRGSFHLFDLSFPCHCRSTRGVFRRSDQPPGSILASEVSIELISAVMMFSTVDSNRLFGRYKICLLRSQECKPKTLAVDRSKRGGSPASPSWNCWL